MKLLGTPTDAVPVALVEGHLQLAPATLTAMCFETAVMMSTHLVNQVFLLIFSCVYYSLHVMCVS